MRTVLRALLIAGAATLTITLESSVVPHLRLPFAAPDLILLAVLALAAEWGTSSGAATGFAIGFVQDLAPPSLDALGRHALILTVVGALAGRAGREVRRSALRTSVLAGLCAGLAVILNTLIGLALGDGTGLSRPGLLLGVLAAALYTAVATPLVVPALAVPARRLGEPDVRYLSPMGHAGDGSVLPGAVRSSPVPTTSELRPESERV